MGEGTDVVWVDRPAVVPELCNEAEKAGVVAVDTEADSFHSYFPKVCLIQLSFDGRHALLDTLCLASEDLAPLRRLLQNPQVLKIFHGADYDLRMLQKDFGFSVRHLADTQAAAQVLGEKQTSLAALLARELGVNLDKTHQRADWALRPLPLAMVEYATNDTRHLEQLHRRLMARLHEVGRVDWWLEECKALESVTYQAPEPDPLAFRRIKGARELKGESLGRLASLWRWREEVAQRLDVPPFRVLSAEILLRLAKQAPSNWAELATTAGLPRKVIRRWGQELLSALQRPEEVQFLPSPGRSKLDPNTARLLQKLRAARDAEAARLGLDPGFVAPRNTLEAVANLRPQEEEQWFFCLKRRWRVSVLRQAFEQVLAEV